MGTARTVLSTAMIFMASSPGLSQGAPRGQGSGPRRRLAAVAPFERTSSRRTAVQWLHDAGTDDAREGLGAARRGDGRRAAARSSTSTATSFTRAPSTPSRCCAKRAARPAPGPHGRRRRPLRADRRRGRRARRPRSGQGSELARNAREWGIPLLGPGDPRQGIVHVVGPEQGLTLPGLTIVCGDSHTSTHGAFGALAFGIGASEVEHVLATQTIWQRRPKVMRVWVDGRLGHGVGAKDLVLHLIATHRRRRAAPDTRSSTRARRSARSRWKARMTLCNMAIEAGARAGMVAPDETTFAYLEGRPLAPRGDDWDARSREWRGLAVRRGRGVRPRGHGRCLRGRADRDLGHEPRGGGAHLRSRARPRGGGRSCPARQPRAGARLHGARARHAVSNRSGSTACSSGRARTAGIEDLRAAAAIVRGRRAVVPAMVVPGSGLVRRAGRGRGPRPRLPRGRVRVARARLLDVRRDERRPGRPASAARRPPTGTSRAGRAGRPHPPHEPRDGRGCGGHGPAHRRAPAPAGGSLRAARNAALHPPDGVAAPLDLPNVDTDRVIPARFLRKPRSAGYGQFCFHDLGRPAGRNGGPRVRPEPARLPRGADPRGGRELRLRLVTRGRGVGARGARDPRRDRPELRRHLPRELPPERPPARAPARAAP